MKDKIKLNNYFVLSYNLNLENLTPNNNNFEIIYGDKTPIKILQTSKTIKSYFIGHPKIYSNNQNEKIEDFWKNNYRKIGQYKNIDCEFVIINLSQDIVEVINSRFSSPQVYYFKDKDILIISSNFYAISLILNKLNKFQIDNLSLFEFLNYRRIFDVDTLDINTKILEPASILTFENSTIKIKKYWRPSFIKKNKSLEYFSKKLILATKNSIKKKYEKRNSCLLLSGGLDTRFILSMISKINKCYTITYSKNLELKIAKRIANICSIAHEWIQIKKNHYNNNFNHNIRCIGGSYMGDGLLMSHDKIEQNQIIYSGYAFDYFFQGMYIPQKNIKLFGKKTFFKKKIKISENATNFFINNINYKNYDEDLYKLFNRKDLINLKQKHENKLNNLIEKNKDILNNLEDQYEFLCFHNLSRHYTYGGQLAISEMSEHRVIGYTNEIYDLYLSMPSKYRFDGKVIKRALKINNKELANIPSANHGFKVTDSSFKIGVKHIFDYFFKLKFIRKNKGFDRTWFEIDKMLDEELFNKVLETKNNLLINLSIFNKKNLNYLLSNFVNKKIKGNKTILLITTINNFLSQIK